MHMNMAEMPKFSAKRTVPTTTDCAIIDEGQLDSDRRISLKNRRADGMWRQTSACICLPYYNAIIVTSNHLRHVIDWPPYSCKTCTRLLNYTIGVSLEFT